MTEEKRADTVGADTMASPTESTKRFYNDHVDDYISNIENAGVTHAPSAHLSSFIGYLHKSFPGIDANEALNYKVLELGCGYGRDAQLLAQTGNINVIATDYSRSMLLKAQERLEESGGSVHFLELDMRNVGQHFLPNSLHGIWACATMIHLPKNDIPALLGSLFSVLRPGGVVYVSVKLKQSETNGETFDPDERYGGIRKFYAFYEVEELLNYFRQQSFEIVDSGTSDHRSKDPYATHPFVHVFARKPI